MYLESSLKQWRILGDGRLGAIALFWKKIFRFFLAKTSEKLFIIITPKQVSKSSFGLLSPPSEILDPALAQRKPEMLQYHFIGQWIGTGQCSVGQPSQYADEPLYSCSKAKTSN